jgi:MoxR-like ATPase
MASLTSRSRTNGNNKFFDAELDRIERRSRMEYQQLVEAEVRERLADAERPRLDELPVVHAIVSNIRLRIMRSNSHSDVSSESIEHMKAILAMVIKKATDAHPNLNLGNVDIASGATKKIMKRISRFNVAVRNQEISDEHDAAERLAAMESTRPRKAVQ